MKAGDIYRLYNHNDKMLHWRVNGAISRSMLCGKGDFLVLPVNSWHLQRTAGLCQECEVLYVLELMRR